MMIIASIGMVLIAAFVFCPIATVLRMITMANIKDKWTMARVMWAIDFVLFALIFAALWLRG